ncbi:polyprenyl synthetase family protein [bacterium]|nr:polyprenyl synthetase family protein [bacterium]
MLAKLYEPIQRELDAVRAAVALELGGLDAQVRPVAEQAVGSPGKSIRPALLLLSGKAVGPVGESHVAAAASIELIHGATLVHDDVIDDASERRSRSTVHARWGGNVSILLGDMLFARALETLASVTTAEQLGLVAGAVSETCEGELLQLFGSRGDAFDEARYFEVIRKKTGAPCGAACALGAALAGQPADGVERFDAFGRTLGAAFQIVDDCLDIRGDERTVGKTLGTDLLAGRSTLPVLYARDHASPEALHHFDHLLEHPESPHQRVRLAAILDDCGAFDYCEHAASRLVQDATAQLDFLGESAARQSLVGMAQFVAQRDR